MKNIRKIRGYPYAAMCVFIVLASCRYSESTSDPYRMAGGRNYWTGYPAVQDSSVTAVVEIPAGTHAKWEVSVSGAFMEWELKDGKRRVIQYLPYPCNYGMIPGTLQSADTGGDGDPLDILVLGRAVERGEVIPVRLLGVLKMLDDGEVDDKLIAVSYSGPLSDVRSLDELREKYPGVTEILEIWFVNYKGPGRIQLLGYETGETARIALERAAEEFRKNREW